MSGSGRSGSTCPHHRARIGPAEVRAGKRKNPSRVREVCARVWGTVAAPYVVVRDGHCGPARLLPIIMTNEDTEAVWHRTAAVNRPSQDAGVRGAPGETPGAPRTACSGQGVHPAVGVLGGAALDVEQALAQLEGDRAGGAVALGPLAARALHR